MGLTKGKRYIITLYLLYTIYVNVKELSQHIPAIADWAVLRAFLHVIAHTEIRKKTCVLLLILFIFIIVSILVVRQNVNKK